MHDRITGVLAHGWPLWMGAVIVAVSLSGGGVEAQGFGGNEPELLKWWPVLVTAGVTVAWAIRVEALAKSVANQREALRGEFLDKLTFYATTAELGEVRGQVLVAISQLNDLKPTLTRLESKLDAVLIARLRDQHLRDGD